MKWRQIADTIRQQIQSGDLAPGSRFGNEHEMAAEWGVSRATIHRSMSELQREGWVARQRRTGSVVADRSQHSVGRIAWLVHWSEDRLAMDLTRGIRDALPESADLLLYDTRRDAERESLYLRRLQHEVNGILIIPSCDPRNDRLLHRVAQQFPIVCVDRVPPSVSVDAVLTDNLGSSIEGLRELVKRGHRRIAHFTHDEPASSVRDREEAWRTVMTEVGVSDLRPLLRVFPVIGSHAATTSAYQYIHDALVAMMYRPDPPTAVFCLHDYIAAGLLDACEVEGIDVPGQLEILTFHDAVRFPIQQLNSIDRLIQQPRQIGKLAVERLLQLMSGAEPTGQVQRVAARVAPHGQAFVREPQHTNAS